MKSPQLKKLINQLARDFLNNVVSVPIVYSCFAFVPLTPIYTHKLYTIETCLSSTCNTCYHFGVYLF